MNPNILTPAGYKNWTELHIGDKVCAFNLETGEAEINLVDDIEVITPTTITNYQGETSPFILYDSESNETPFTYFKVNGIYNFFYHQSVWNSPTSAPHAFELQIGDKLYDDEDNEITITTIEEVSDKTQWIRFRISGDHSYIADGITLHNAARFWVGAGSSTNWSATVNTNWSLTSGGANNQAVPTSADDVTFDGAGSGNGTCVVDTSARVAKTLVFTTGFTGTFQQDQQVSVSGSITLTASSFSWTGTATNKLRMIAAGTWTTATRSIPHDVEIGATTTFTCTLADTWSCGTNALLLSNTTSTIFSGAFNMTAGAITIQGSQTVTMSGNITGSGTCVIADANLMAGSFILSVAGITMTGTLGISANTPTVTLSGGTWSGAAVLSVNTSFAGNVIVSGSVAFSGTLTYSSGTITTTGSTLNLAGSTTTTLDVASITWIDIAMTGTSKTYTLNSNLNWSGTLTDGTTTAITWSGAFTMIGGAITYTTAGTRNYNVTSVSSSTNTMPDTAITIAGTLSTYTSTTWTNTLITAARTHTLTETITFANTNFSPVTPTAAAGTIRLLTITSAHASTKVVFKVAVTGTQTPAFVSPTRLDSSGGQCLLTLGTITTSYNWTTTVSAQNILNAGGGEALTLAGVTRNRFGSVIGSCDCYLFRDNGNNTSTYLAYNQSDASGNYSFTVFAGSTYYVVGFKTGSPDKMDVTDRVLTGV